MQLWQDTGKWLEKDHAIEGQVADFQVAGESRLRGKVNS